MGCQSLIVPGQHVKIGLHQFADYSGKDKSGIITADQQLFLVILKMHVEFLIFQRCGGQAQKNARNSHVLTLNYSKYSPIFIFFHWQSNKPFLMWLLTIPPHLEYVATLFCNLSLIACFLTLLFHEVMRQHTQRSL